MRFRDDTRGVTVQVGAVLLFATIIIALSVYQATVVPAENSDVEYRHSQQVQGQLVDVRNALVSTATTGDGRPATVSLGTEYPNRVFLVNPPPAAGTLRTNTTADPDIEVSNVEATNEETRDYLDGSWVQPTTSLTYVPGYNEYRDAPRLRYDASVLSNYYPDQNTSVPLTEQLLVNEQTRTVSLVALNGSLSTSRSSAVAVDPAALSAPAERVQVQPQVAGQPVNVTIPTVVDAAVLRNSTSLGDNPNVTVAQNGTDRVTLSIDWDDPFTLRTAMVGVGSGATNPAPHYLTLVEADDDSVTVEARDEYNNPESGVEVNVSDESLFEEKSKVTGVDGRATFEAVDGVFGPVTLSIFANSAARERVETEVDTRAGAATNGSEAYVVDWLEGASAESNPGLTCSSDEQCVLNASEQSTVTLTATSVPTVDGGEFDFATNDTDNGSVSPTNALADNTGNATTEFSAEGGGTVLVYTSSGGSGDRLEIDVQNFTREVVYNSDGQAVTGPGQTTPSGVSFSVTNNRQSDVTVTDIRVDPANPVIARLDDPSTGFGQYESEFYMTTPGDGDEYTTDFANGRALPLKFDLSDGQLGTDTEHLIEAGESAEYTLYEFLDENDNSVDMSGEEVEITLFFSDSTQKTFTINGDGDSGEGFSSTSTTSIVPNAGEQTQTIEFTMDSAMDASESIEVDLSDAQSVSPDQVDYQSGSASVVSGPSPSNLGFAQQSSTDAVVTYSPSSDLSAGQTVTLEVTGVSAGPTASQNSPYAVTWSRTDGGSKTATFSVSSSAGDSNLQSVSVSDLGSGPGQSQTVSFTPDDALEGGERVAIDLSEAQAGAVDYSNAGVNSVSTGSASKNQNGDTVYVAYTAPSGGVTSGTTVDVELTGVEATGSGTYDAGFSRARGDTASATFSAGSASPTYDVTINSATSAGSGNNIDVEFQVDTTDSGATVEVQSLKSDGSVRDTTDQVAVSPSQPQTETVSGDNQAAEVRVILYDSSGNEQARDTVTYP